MKTETYEQMAARMWDEGVSLGQFLKAYRRAVPSPRLRTQTALEGSCAYCASIITGSRCESCGAPRRAEKRHEELYRAWQDQSTFPECLHPEVI